MKILDYLFFGIYNSYYKDGNYNNDEPWYGGLMIFGVVFFLNAIFILRMTYFRNGIFSKPIAFAIGGGALLLSYFLFVKGKRYEVIYFKYQRMNREQRRINAIISWLYVVCSFAIVLVPLFFQAIGIL